MKIELAQEEALRRTIGWARQLRKLLHPLLVEHGHQVHFRPSSRGVSMVGLLPGTPQRGRTGFRNLERVVRDFKSLFDEHCAGLKQGRPTAEKELQSFLIREAYINDRAMRSIIDASRRTSDPVELQFVTDEIALPIDGGKIVCDILALRCDGGRSTPVLLELKSSRDLKRLTYQVDTYANIIHRHAGLFAELFTALLGRTALTFDARPEKWIVWPAVGATADPREKTLSERGIRLCTYHPAYSFRVGEVVDAPDRRA